MFTNINYRTPGRQPIVGGLLKDCKDQAVTGVRSDITGTEFSIKGGRTTLGEVGALPNNF